MILFPHTASRFSKSVRDNGATAFAMLCVGISLGAAASAAPSMASSGAPYYSVELASPASKAHTIVGGVLWQCNGTTCIAAKSSSRPAMMCKRVAREFGEVSKFSAGGEVLTAEQLASCNAG